MKAALHGLLLTVLLGGCTSLSTGFHGHAVSVSLAKPPILDRLHHTVTVIPHLELRNPYSAPLTIVMYGGTTGNLTTSFEIRDPAGAPISEVKRAFRYSAFWGNGRVTFHNLRRGEILTWESPYEITFPAAQPGRYRLIARVRLTEVYLSSSVRTGRIREFESPVLIFRVK